MRSIGKWMMRHRMLLGILLFLALNHLLDWGPFNTLVVFAQSTTVTGQVKDVNGVPYAGAQMKAGLVFAGTPVSNPTVTISTLSQCRANGFGSAPCQVPFAPSNGPFNLDSGGNIPGGGITLQDNSQVTPSGTQWAFTVNTPGNPPPLGTGPQTCTATITISGASQSVSTSFAACPVLSSGGGGGGGGSPVLINQSVDNFNRTGTGLGPNWTPYLNGINTTLGPPGFAQGTSATLFNVSAYTAVTSNPTQRVRTGVLVIGATSSGPALRISGTPGTSVSFYVCSLTTAGLSIVRVTGASNGAVGTTTTLASSGNVGANGDFLDFGIVGNTLSCMRNGSTSNGFLQVNDTSPLTTGLPGIEFGNNVAEIGYWTFFNPLMPAGGTENIVFDGDSIIAANGQGSPQTDPATSFLFLPNTTAYAANVGVGNKCVGVGCAASTSGTVESMLSTGPTVIDPLFVPGVKNILVLLSANNDVVVGGRTPAQVITDMTTYVANRHAAGWKVIVCQSLSRLTTSAPGTDQQETNLAQLIAPNPMGADAIIVWPYALTAMGASSNTNLFNSDQIHPTELTHVDIFARFLSSTLSKF